MSKSKCAFCVKFDGSKCRAKGVSVEPHKPRRCGKYVMDSAAVFADEQRKVQAELSIPKYQKTFRSYETDNTGDVPTAAPDDYILVNRRTASIPKKLLLAAKRLQRKQNKVSGRG